MENTFEVVSGAIVCSDPCYELPTWCQGIVDNVKNGTWIAEIVRSDEGDWGERIALLSIKHKDIAQPENNVDIMDFVGGVDSGQFGFFDKDFYRNDEKAKDLPKYSFSGDFDKEVGDQWYRACCALTLGAKDGSGEYVYFCVIFIEAENEDEGDVCGICNEEYMDCTCEDE